MNEPACRECGFLLRGHLSGGAVPRCPECGAVFDPAAPWTPEPIPSARSVGVRLCGPLLIVLALLIAASATSLGRNLLVWPFFLVWISAIGGIGGLWPLGWVYETVREHVPRVDQGPLTRRWLAAVLAFNAAATLLCLVVFFLML